MPILSDPTLKIELDSTNNAKRKLTTTVKVTFSATEKAAMQALGGNYRLRCHIWGKDVGEDSGLNGTNDPLYENDPALAKGKWITTDGIHTVFNNASVDTASLDEDDTFQDEIIARFSCVPNSNMVPGSATPVNSPKVSGNF